jgi:hypothetical protein
MKGLVAIIGGIFMLIGIYLFINKGDATVKIIDSLGKNAIGGISTLQGNIPKA